MSRQKDLAKNTAILTFGKICTQCISFFLLPLYTALLDTSEYGIFDLLITYATLLIPLVNWQFDQGLFRFMLGARGNREKESQLFSTVLIINTIQVIAFIVILIVVSRIIVIPYTGFLLIYVSLLVYTNLYLQFVRGLGKSVVYAIASFISASSTVVFNVIALVALKMGVGGLFVSTILAQIVTITYLALDVKPWQYFRFKYVNFDVFKMVRKYSLPLIPNNLAWWVVNVSDRTIVSYILGVALNGIYTVANKFSNVFISFYNIFNLSWTETVSLHYQDKDRDQFLSETMTTLYKLFSCACFGIVALMPFIFPILIDEKYVAAYPQILILMYAMLLRIIVGLYSCIYVAMKETKKVATTSAIAAIINIVVHLTLIEKIGLYAASISTFVAFGSMAIVRYIDINKTVKMKISTSVFVSSLVISVVLAVVYYQGNRILSVFMLLTVCIYSIVLNWKFALSAFNMAKEFIKRFR